MFDSIIKFFKKITKSEQKEENSKNTAKERLHLVLMQDRANVSADFLEMMKQEILEVIKKYIEIDEKEIDVHLTNKPQDDGTNGAPFLYANIPILNIKSDMKKSESTIKEEDKVLEEKSEETKNSNEKEIAEEPKEKIKIEVKEEKIENKEENKEQIKEKKTEEINKKKTTSKNTNNSKKSNSTKAKSKKS